MTQAIRDQAFEEAARGLQVIGDIIEHWLNWVKREHGGEVAADTHLILGGDNAPPTWPSVGQLAKWLETIRALKGTPPSPVDGDEVERVARALAAFEYERDLAHPMPTNYSGSCYQWRDWWHEAQAAIAAMPPSPDLLKELVEALEVIARGDEPRPVAESWLPDGQLSKSDKCSHGRTMYEDCGQCVADFAAAALLKVQQEKGDGR